MARLMENDLQEWLAAGWLWAENPERWWLGWGELLWVAEPRPPALYAPDFLLRDSKPWLQCRQVRVVSAQELRAGLNEFLMGAGVCLTRRPGLWAEPDVAEFAGRFQEIQTAIRDGELHKAVPVVFAESTASVGVLERAHWLERLTGAPANLHAYGFWLQETGILGATPEILFSCDLQTGVLETMALAGTLAKPHSEAERAAFFRDPKETREHRLVVEDLRERLARWGDVEEGPLELLDLPALTHLKTEFRVCLRTSPTSGGQAAANLGGGASGFESFVRALHPTPALGVSPRACFGTWSERLAPPGDRGRFGAPFGLLTAEKMSCGVAIRCVQWQNQTRRIGSGCGVIAASLLESEWRELARKRDSVRALLGLDG